MSGGEKPLPCPGVMRITPYVPGKSYVPGAVRIIKLSSNETPLGASEKAIEAFRESANSLERYPDTSASVLRETLARKYSLDAARIVCGTGSDDLINLIARAYLGPGDEAIIPQYGFLIFRIATYASGAFPVLADESHHHANVESILNLVTDKTKVVFLANPNNPTGTYLPINEIKRLRDGLPDKVLLVLDAAYSEYIKLNDYKAGIELVEKTDNTVMTRTFSKVYGLASLRLGWAYCPLQVADALNRIRGPFNVPGPAISAGVAALDDTIHVEKAIVHNDKWLAWLKHKIENLDIQVTPSVTNFLLLNFNSAAENADRFLQSRGIILRPVADYGLPNSLRLTVGTEEENLAFIEALTEFMNQE